MSMKLGQGNDVFLEISSGFRSRKVLDAVFDFLTHQIWMNSKIVRSWNRRCGGWLPNESKSWLKKLLMREYDYAIVNDQCPYAERTNVIEAEHRGSWSPSDTKSPTPIKFRKYKQNDVKPLYWYLITRFLQKISTVQNAPWIKAGVQQSQFKSEKSTFQILEEIWNVTIYPDPEGKWSSTLNKEEKRQS